MPDHGMTSPLQHQRLWVYRESKLSPRCNQGSICPRPRLHDSPFTVWSHPGLLSLPILITGLHFRDSCRLRIRIPIHLYICRSCLCLTAFWWSMPIDLLPGPDFHTNRRRTAVMHSTRADTTRGIDASDCVPVAYHNQGHSYPLQALRREQSEPMARTGVLGTGIRIQ